jgi:hypothetical protein
MVKDKKVDRLFHTLESKGIECHFFDTHVTVVPKDKNQPSFIVPFETGISRLEAHKNTAKFLAHWFGVRYNAPL